ncbi:MAG TPA: hypothetical protein DD375_02315, partial [Hyphomonas sp.]|nr:hypothetical protein [Hyphomonas sp.]
MGSDTAIPYPTVGSAPAQSQDEATRGALAHLAVPGNPLCKILAFLAGATKIIELRRKAQRSLLVAVRSAGGALLLRPAARMKAGGHFGLIIAEIMEEGCRRGNISNDRIRNE